MSIRIIIIAAALALLLTACGGGGTPAQPADASAELLATQLHLRAVIRNSVDPQRALAVAEFNSNVPDMEAFGVLLTCGKASRSSPVDLECRADYLLATTPY